MNPSASCSSTENSAENSPSFNSDNRTSMTYPLYPSLLFMTATSSASIIALRAGAILVREINRRSVHRRPAAAFLVFLPRAAGTRIVPPDFGNIAPGLTRVCTRTDLPMLPEIAMRPQQSSRHVHDDFFALLWADRLGAHLRVFIVLVMEHHHRNQAAAVLLVVDKLSPAVVAHGRAPHEAMSPVVAVRHAVRVLQQERDVDLTLEQRPGDVVPVPHHQPQNFIGFVEACELAGVRYLAAEDLPVVFARHHGLRSRDEGGEESVELLDVHRLAALATLEEVAEAVKFCVSQWLVLGEGLHGEPSGGSFCFPSILRGIHSSEPSILSSRVPIQPFLDAWRTPLRQRLQQSRASTNARLFLRL